MRDLKIEDLKDGVLIKNKESGQIKKVHVVGKTLVYLGDESIEETISAKDLSKYYLIEDTKNEVEELIESRSNGTYNQISDDASAIIATLGTDEYAYFFSQIANKLARIKHGYSVEDSLLDIAGYAKLELDKFRGEQ